MPDGALLGVQHITTDDYVMIVGFIDQTQVNLNADDYGGELDPHGADLVSHFSSPYHTCTYLFADGQPHGRCPLLQPVPDWQH